MSDFTERLIADFACLDPVYVDGIFAEGVMNLGANFATPYFRWTPTGRAGNGVVSMERTPALLPGGKLDFWKCLVNGSHCSFCPIALGLLTQVISEYSLNQTMNG